jgi:hypothetical protein
VPSGRRSARRSEQRHYPGPMGAGIGPESTARSVHVLKDAYRGVLVDKAQDAAYARGEARGFPQPGGKPASGDSCRSSQEASREPVGGVGPHASEEASALGERRQAAQGWARFFPISLPRLPARDVIRRVECREDPPTSGPLSISSAIRPTLNRSSQ